MVVLQSNNFSTLTVSAHPTPLKHVVVVQFQFFSLDNTRFSPNTLINLFKNTLLQDIASWTDLKPFGCWLLGFAVLVFG